MSTLGLRLSVKKEVTLIAERFTESSVTYWLSKTISDEDHLENPKHISLLE